MSQQGLSAQEGNRNTITRILYALTEPASEIQQLENRRQARFLSALLLLMSPAALFVIVVPSLPETSGALISRATTYLALFSFVVSQAIYLLSRTRYYTLAATCAVMLASTAVLIAVSMDINFPQVEAAYYLVLPVLLCSVLLSMRMTLLVAALQAVALPIVATSALDRVADSHLVDGFTFYATLSFLILLLAHHRNQLEGDRRTLLAAEQKKLEAAYNNLENRIAERTAELSDLNAHLRQQIADREHAEASLVEERNMLRALIEHMPDLVFVLDTDLRYVLDNAAHRRQMGVETLDDIVGKTAFDFFPYEEAKSFSQIEQGIIESGQPVFNVQLSYAEPMGQQRWGLANRIPFRNSLGHVIGLVGIVHDITDLKQAETILRQTYHHSEQRLNEQNLELSNAYARLWYQANLLENVSEAIVATDMQGVIQSWNRAAEACYGLKAEEVVGRSAWEVFQDGTIFSQLRVAADRLQEYKTWEGEIPFRRSDGHTLYFMASASVIQDHERKAIGAVIVSRDVTQHKKAEAAEQEHRLFAEAMRDTAAAINSTLDLNEVLDRIFLHITRIVPCDMANVSLVKDGMSRVVRYWGSLEEVEEQKVLATHFEVAQTPTMRTMKATQQPLFVPDTDDFEGWIHKGGIRIRSYIGAPIKIQGEVIGFLNVSSLQPDRFEDTYVERMTIFAEQVAIAMRNAQLFETIRNHAADLIQHVAYRTAELERERTQLKIILDSMSEGVISSILTDTGVLKPVYTNPAVRQLLGYELWDWHDQLVVTQIMVEPDNPSLYQKIFEAIAVKGYWHGEATIRRKDGSEFKAFVSSSRVNNPDDVFIGVVTVLRDISQEKALQEQRSRFVANASHELRTPITNLMTRLWLLRKQPERLDEHLVILEEVANRMRYLVEDLLDVSRLERGTIPIEPVDMDLRAVVEAVVQLQQAEAEQKQIRLEGHLPDAPLMIWGDPRRVHQVITNLVVNAINYTPPGGSVRVDADMKLGADSDSGYVIIEVRDSGMGIPPEHLEHLFQPFYRIGEQGKGTGLGLAIAREIVRMHGGDISVETEVGKGSCFSVRFALQTNTLISNNGQ